MDQNERTPGSIEKTTTKRSFLEMLGVAGPDTEGTDQPQKRAKPLESRGRRLFGPSSQETTCRHIQLQPINEEDASPSKRQKENSAAEDVSPLHKLLSTPGHSPLSENVNHMYTSPPTTSAAAAAAAATSEAANPPISAIIYSPTSNLPNYVLDGEAPHLGIMSPKRKAKEKVDWLTNIRKQKLMSGRAHVTLSDKISEEQQADVLASPRLQSLRQSECSPRLQATPRRRISHTDGGGGTPAGNSSHPHTQHQPRTPTSSRRNSETTLLRFFSIQRSSSVPAEESATATAAPSSPNPPAVSGPAATPLSLLTPTTAVGSD